VFQIARGTKILDVGALQLLLLIVELVSYHPSGTENFGMFNLLVLVPLGLLLQLLLW